MKNIKSKQFPSLLTLSTASIDVDVVSGSLGSSTLPWLSGSFRHMDINGDV